MISRHLGGRVSALVKVLLAGVSIAGMASGIAACDSPDAEAIGTPSDPRSTESSTRPSTPAPAAPAASNPTVAPVPPILPDGNFLDFVGAWKSATSPITTIVFENIAGGAGHTFFAYRADAKVRAAGIYTLPQSTLVLESKAAGIAGPYVYSFTSANELVLGNGSGSHVYLRQPSYCDQPSDCAGQGINHVACVGGFSCEKNLCSWVCEVPVDPPSGTPCGPKAVCGSGEVCCNESCGTCTAPGQACSKQLCASPPTKCGNSTCAAGEVCCNESCGICTKPGDQCTQQVCPVDK